MKISLPIHRATFGLVLIYSFCMVQAQDLSNLKTVKPFDIHGNLNLNLQSSTSNGMAARQQPFEYVVSANLTPSIYGLSLPFSFTYSNRQASYTQPFNRFGISPNYKWITLHAGYRNLNFSNYTLAGHSFLGGGIELNPGKFRFGLIGGRFNKNTTTNSLSPTDNMPEYKRNGAAMKIGVGGKKTFVDLLLLSVKDVSTSIPIDTTYPSKTPQENLIAGLNTRITFSEKFYFEGEFAASAHTSDQFALGFGIDSSLLAKTDKIIHVNQSSRLYTAGRASLVYKAKPLTIKAEYRRIDPNYTSFGAYYMTTDIQSFAVGPAFSLFKRKLSIKGSFGLENDNLRNTKKVTTIRTVGSANLSWNPSQIFGVDGSYSNFSIDQKAGNNPLLDTSKIYQSNSNFVLSPRITLFKGTSNHLFMLMLNHTNLNDKNPKTEAMTENRVNTANLNYSLMLTEKKITLNAGLNYMKLTNYTGDNMAMGFSAGIMGMLAKDLLSIGWSNCFLTTEYLGNKGKVVTSQLTLGLSFKKQHQFRLGAYFTGNFYDKGASVPSYNQIKGDFSYVFSF